LLDFEDPSKVTHRTKDWILQPEEDYETQGCYAGGGVVFPCGKVVIDETLFVYYGGADKYVGLATCELDELLQYLLACPVTG
ncbi:MAG: glycoside hydrolase family 130 protein, partial [Planctomycetota bacterium]